jgi:alpha-aminoadipate/glutamate carrier protein LysW
MANCPECDAEIEVDEADVDKGDLLSCPECGSSLEVISVSPLEFDIALEDDDEDDDDDDLSELGEEEEGEDEDDEEDEGVDE